MNSTITVDGIQFKVTRLPIAHGAAALRWTDRIKGGSTRVRTGAGSRSVNQSTKATAQGGGTVSDRQAGNLKLNTVDGDGGGHNEGGEV